MECKYIDTHCHLQEEEYDIDRTEVIARMKEAGVGATVIGTHKESSARAVALAENEENIYTTIGVHPVDKNEVFDYEFFKKLVASKKVVAVGECGFDYFRTDENDLESERIRQRELFIEQMSFALEHDLPLMIHCRPSKNSNDAHEDLISIFEEAKKLEGDKLRGTIHFFTGSIEIAQRYIDLGFYISIPGVVTFAKDVAETAKMLPIERILSETDSPYASPIPHRGNRNEPFFVKDIVKYVAEIRGISEPQMSEIFLQNAKKLFRLEVSV